ncbi:hypothetical protein Pelo_16802 [Pelomyxa schiedti]|nr:hypothetical protein Pelo_16802 [Pelomyxa schiedti]
MGEASLLLCPRCVNRAVHLWLLSLSPPGGSGAYSATASGTGTGVNPLAISKLVAREYSGMIQAMVKRRAPHCGLRLTAEWNKANPTLNKIPVWVPRALIAMRVTQLIGLTRSALVRLQLLAQEYPSEVSHCCTTEMIRQAGLNGDPEVVSWCVVHCFAPSPDTACRELMQYMCTNSTVAEAQQVCRSMRMFVSAQKVKDWEILQTAIKNPIDAKGMVLWLITEFSCTRDDFAKRHNYILRMACLSGDLPLAQWVYEQCQFCAYDARIMGRFCLLCSVSGRKLGILKWLVEQVGLNTPEDIRSALDIAERNGLPEETEYLKQKLSD